MQPNYALASTPQYSDAQQALINHLERWVERGWLRALDAEFPLQLLPLSPECPAPVLLITALLSHQYGRGHSCLDLSALLDNPQDTLSLPPPQDLHQPWPDTPQHLLQNISASELFTSLLASGWASNAADEQVTPIILNGNRAYLRRLWQAEQRVRQAVAERVKQTLATHAKLTHLLDALFTVKPDETRERPDWQKLACAMAAQRQFSIITGGPGTGKTTTVVRLLALLQQTRTDTTKPLHILLAAPTGKAAARLSESIGDQLNQFPESIRQQLPSHVSTLHRLLGAIPNKRSFRHHAGNPLAADVVVIDEASMIDLEMMAAVFAALPEHCKLILLGDKDQLASVEAGSVLGDLCTGAKDGRYHLDTLTLLQPFSDEPLTQWLGDGSDANQVTVMLRTSRRFDNSSGIGQLSYAVRDGQTDALSKFQQFADLNWIKASEPDDPRLRALTLEGYQHYLQAMQKGTASLPISADAWALQLLKHYSHFQVLCAIREGDWGIESWNQRIEKWLSNAGYLQLNGRWYPGRPVMVQRNNYPLNLMNGDIGLCLRHPDSNELRVAFPMADGSVKWVQPSRLNDVETVFAMTVHKSQGSEFKHCVLVLPNQINPIMTRELLYTGLTRARENFTLVAGSDQVVKRAIQNQVERNSGL